MRDRLLSPIVVLTRPATAVAWWGADMEAGGWPPARFRQSDFRQAERYES